MKEGTLMGIIVELPCNIGDNIYELIVDKISREIYLDRYVVQDVSMMSIKYSDEWNDRKEIGTKIFLNKEMAEKVFEDMKISNEYKECTFFKEFNDE